MQIVYPKYKKILQNYVAYVVHIKPETRKWDKQPRDQEEQENRNLQMKLVKSI